MSDALTTPATGKGIAENKMDDTNIINKIETGSLGTVENLQRQQTHRGLKSRHTQMIALGGTIGTGLFVGSGQGLRMGGPGFLLLSYIIISALVFGVVTATTEFSSYLPVPGSTVAYFGNRFFSKSMGFALGWIFWYVCTVTVPAEITAASLVIEYWNPPVHVGVWIAIIMVVIIALNCFPVSVYGEVEFWFASLKVIGIIGLLFMAVVITTGGAPNGEVIGFKYWRDPGATNEYLVSGASGRLVSFIATITFSVFAFVFAPELLVITGGEMQDPRRNLPVAGRRYIYRLVIFYILGIFFLGMIIPSNDPELLGGGKGAGASPWAIGARNAGIRGLDSVINGIILASAWSAGNAWLYMSSRSLYSMAVYGIAPSIFKRCTARGIPYMAIGFSSMFALLAFLNVSDNTVTVFNWFINLINSAGFISWICICAIYLRFRKATAAQGVTDDLPYRSIFQPYASYVCMTAFTILLLLTGFVNFLDGRWNTSNFITSYIGLVIFGVAFFGHKFLKDWDAPWVIRAEEVDLRSGLAEILEEESPYVPRTLPWYMKWKMLWE